jgi:hypothetical protein
MGYTMELNNKYVYAAWGVWTGLGFIRGLQYDYYHHIYNPWLITKAIIPGFYGSLLYGCPIFLLLTGCRELYRLEIWARKLPYDQDYYSLI